MENIRKHEEELTKYTLKKLKEIPWIIVYGSKDYKKRGALFSFHIEGIHPHDICAVLDKYGIAVRGGHMCVQPLVTQKLGVNAITRASLYFYNTTKEVDLLVEAIKKTKEIFLGNGRKS